MKSLYGECHLPMIMIGDFNEITSAAEKGGWDGGSR